MKLYKLTTRDGYTRNDTKWGPGVTHKVPRRAKPELCTGDVLHAYTDPTLALLLNPIHADIANPQLWEARGNVVVKEWDKVGVFRLTTIKKINRSEWMKSERLRRRVRVIFAILCARAVFAKKTDRKWQLWADEYLAGNTSRTAARKAYSVANYDVTSTAAMAACSMDHDPYHTAYTARGAAWRRKNINFAALARKAVKLATCPPA